MSVVCGKLKDQHNFFGVQICVYRLLSGTRMFLDKSRPKLIYQIYTNDTKGVYQLLEVANVEMCDVRGFHVCLRFNTIKCQHIVSSSTLEAVHL